jgi:glutathione S-transferase
MVLYQFIISHFCEKARWALDHKQVAYRQRSLVPGLHIPVIKRLTGHTTVPVLVDGGLVVRGSGAIIDHLDAVRPARPLTPSDTATAARVRARELDLDRRLGETIRQIAYFHLLGEGDLVQQMWAQEITGWQRWVLPVVFPVARRVVGRMYELEAQSVRAAEVVFAEAMAELDAQYEADLWLQGGCFGRLDLTVAALLAPLVEPPGHRVAWPAQRPAAWAAWCAQFDQSPTVRRVRDLYAQHRRPVAH